MEEIGMFIFYCYLALFPIAFIVAFINRCIEAVKTLTKKQK